MNFHDASKASYGKYSQRVSTKKHEWGVKEGRWIKKQELTKEQMDAVHALGATEKRSLAIFLKPDPELEAFAQKCSLSAFLAASSEEREHLCSDARGYGVNRQTAR